MKKYFTEEERILARRKQVRENFRRWCAKNPDRRKEINRRWVKANRAKLNARNKRWKLENPQRTRAFNIKAQKKRIEMLSDNYLREKIARKNPVLKKFIPQSLIETKRLLIKIKRLCKNQTT